MSMKTVVVFAFLSLFAYSEAAHVTCEFKTDDWYVPGSYKCSVQNSLNIQTREEATVESASPSPGQTVKVFSAHKKTIHFFPRNFEKFFASLDVIAITHSELKEIEKDDMKPFPQLRMIDFGNNAIQVIEQDLFLHNPNLEFVAFHGNKISQIDPNVFDQLGKLRSLYLWSNICVNRNVYNYATAVKSLIDELKTKCRYSTSTTTPVPATTMLSPTITAVPSSVNNDIQMAKWNATESRMVRLEASMKQTEAKLETELKDIKARMSALEAMTQKILEMFGNLTAVNERA